MLIDRKKNKFFKAAVLFKSNSKLKVLDDIIFPRIKDRQILVKILFTSVCGSQLFEISGGRGRDKFLPHMLGHEATGIVINVGKKVKRIKSGDKVFLSWIKNNNEKDCSRIFYESKNYKKRRINSGNVTTFSNYSVVSSNRVYRLPDSINFISGCLLCCALPTGAGMVLNKDSKIDNKKILIVGLGGVGLSSLLAAIYKNYKEIHAVDNNSQRISYLKKKLRRHKIFYYNDIKKLKHSNFDLIIESTGSAKVISASMKYLKNHGKLIFASHPKFGEKIKIDPYDLILGKKIFGSWGGNINFKKHLYLLIKIIKFFKNIESIFFKKFYKLEEINNAINDFKSGKIIRPIIKL
jgi:S-(hydroxymethyl)glutathione dehydrogenase/alcohol dehydrogenase